MKVNLSNLQFRMKAWRGEIPSTGLSSIWVNDFDVYEKGELRFVGSSVTENTKVRNDLEIVIAAIFSFHKSIESYVNRYFGVVEGGRKLVCIESILVPESQRYVVLNVQPVTDDLHEGVGVVVDVESCILKSFNVTNDIGIVSAKEVSIVWDQNLENWKKFPNLELSPTPRNVGDLQSFPPIEKSEEKRFLKSFSKSQDGYVAEWKTKLFSKKARLITVRISDDYIGKPKPEKSHAEALSWLGTNSISVQEETISKLQSELHFSDEEIVELNLAEIVLYEEPLKKVTLVFDSEKFDYDEHGLGVVWSKGKLAHCGHVY